MLIVLKNKSEKPYYWTDWKGDCYADDGSNIVFDELPWELRKAYKEIGPELIGGLGGAFLAEYNNEYGIIFDRTLFGDDTDVYEIAENKARKISETLPNYNVLVDHGEDLNGKPSSTIILFFPWDTKRIELEECVNKFDSCLS